MTSAHGSRSTARSAGGGSPRFSPMTACRGAGASGWNASPSGSRLHTRTVVVYHLYRFARDLAATLDYLRRFSRRGVELHVVGRGRVEADTATGFIVTAVEGLAAEHYRRVISEKTRDALARLRANGRRVSRFARYGYRLAPGRRLVVNPREQVVLAKILALRDRGFSLRAISRVLATQGVLARNGRPFGPSTLLGIVRNRTVENRPETPSKG